MKFAEYKEFEEIAINNNMVMVLVGKDYNKDEESGIEFDNTFDPANHWNIHGRVLAVPEKLVYHGYDIERWKAGYRQAKGHASRIVGRFYQQSMPWDTDMEVMVGDTVVFKYIMHVYTAENGMVLSYDHDHYVMAIPYEFLYMAKRGESTIMLNGYVMVEPVNWTDRELKDIGGGLDPVLTDYAKDGVGIVKRIGTPNRAYLDGNTFSDNRAIKVGDLVGFRHSNQITIEHQMHVKENEGRAWYHMQRRDIFCTFKV